MSFITAIGTANPIHRFKQSDIASFMLSQMKFVNGQAKKLQTIFRASGISYRHSVLSDYGKTSSFDFFSEGVDDVVPSTARRLMIYREHALPLSVGAVRNMCERFAHINLKDITHLIVVSCTGMYAPGLDIELVKALGLNYSVNRTAINFMGCYAAFNGLKLGDAICKADNDAKVLVVCTELCSLHFQPEASDDNMLANALFGDGSAAVLIEGKSESSLQIAIQKFYNALVPEGNESMAWTVGNLGFEMRLSAYVPELIRKGIRSLTEGLLNGSYEKLEEIKHFAIHPGGKKILQVIEEELQLHHTKNQAAYQILNEYGNMSSATVLFVLDALIKSFTPENENERILSFAFGPGLTLESMMLQIKKVQ